MSAAIRCDRCGNVETGNEPTGRVELCVNRNISTAYSRFESVKKDLCEACVRSVYRDVTTAPAEEAKPR